MTDDLPLKLFTIDTLKKLLDNYDESCVSYCLVPILLNIAINHPKLSVDDRIYILKSLFTYLILYQKTLYFTHKPLKEKSSKNSLDVRLFDNALINDTLSTIAAILIVLESNEGDVNFHRIGSNPLEHLFGSFDQCYCKGRLQ